MEKFGETNISPGEEFKIKPESEEENEPDGFSDAEAEREAETDEVGEKEQTVQEVETSEDNLSVVGGATETEEEEQLAEEVEGVEPGEEIQEENERYEYAPEGWMTANHLSEEFKYMFGKGRDYYVRIKSIADQYRTSNPEWFRPYPVKNQVGKVRIEHYAPELVEIIQQGIITEEAEYAPEGWMNTNQLAEEFQETSGKRYYEKIKLIVERYRASNPEWFHPYPVKWGINEPIEHYAPELVEIIRQEIINKFEESEKIEYAPEGWMNRNQLAEEFQETSGKRYYEKIKLIVERYRASNPEWFHPYPVKNQTIKKPVDHYAPELVELIRVTIEEKHEARQSAQELEEQQLETARNLEEFVSDVAEGETLEAQEFKRLVGLFGSARAIDILYKYRPEYSGLPPEYVKSVLAEYLGNYLAAKMPFSLDDVESGLKHLSDPNLKEGLYEVVKESCLSACNDARRSGSTESDAQIISSYLEDIRGKTGSYENLNEVIDRVKEYYRSTFEDFQKPEHIVESLKEDREFPDRNQAINIKEIQDKKRVLIADRMGGGKSASAIMAKEYLGVKQALVVVPSNVVSTWEEYLSDKKDEETGDQIGYFNEGAAPRVFAAHNLDSLKNADLSSFDYVIISQEKLNSHYMTELKERLDYDMLIVDEIHKLKNLAHGVRSANIVELSEKVEGDDKYLVLLSGTPVPNKIKDVATTLKLLYPEKFKYVSNEVLTREIIRGDVIELRSLLVPRMQMKEVTDVMDMPSLIEKIEELELSPEEREIYNIMLEEDEITASQKMQMLRQFLLNPRLLDPTPEVQSTKIRETGNLLRESFEENDKIVMFVNGYVEDVIRGENIIFDGLDLPSDVNIRVIEGTVSEKARAEIKRELQKSGEKILLVVSGDTADVGVDFSGADEVFFYNEPWTEYYKQQQTARVYRPGLKHDLETNTLISTNTIEEGIHFYSPL